MCLHLLIQGQLGKAVLSAQPIDLYALSFFRMTPGIDKTSGLAAATIDPPSFPTEYTQFWVLITTSYNLMHTGG